MDFISNSIIKLSIPVTLPLRPSSSLEWIFKCQVAIDRFATLFGRVLNFLLSPGEEGISVVNRMRWSQTSVWQTTVRSLRELVRPSSVREVGNVFRAVESWKLFSNYNNLSLKIYQTTLMSALAGVVIAEDIIRRRRLLVRINIIINWREDWDDDTPRCEFGRREIWW